MNVSPRLKRWIGQHYERGSAEKVLEELGTLPAEIFGAQDTERIAAALVLGGSWSDFQSRLATAQVDWRDLLVGAELADEDWPSRLNSELGRP